MIRVMINNYRLLAPELLTNGIPYTLDEVYCNAFLYVIHDVSNYLDLVNLGISLTQDKHCIVVTTLSDLAELAKKEGAEVFSDIDDAITRLRTLNGNRR